MKIVEYFAAFPLAETDLNKGLRVSRYLSSPRHVRFSIWDVSEVRAAVSLKDTEARRLSSFLAATDPCARPRFADRLKQSADALLETFR